MKNVLDIAMRLSVMGPKLRHLQSAAQSCRNAAGSVAEVGVYKGGSAMVLCDAFPRRMVIGFDTYCGIPEDDSEIPDGHKKGDFADTSALTVQATLEGHGFVNFMPVIGRFEEKKEKFAGRAFAFAHIDCDISQTAMDAALFFASRVTRGGGIFFDDATSAKTDGVRKAIVALMALGDFSLERGHGTAFLRKIA